MSNYFGNLNLSCSVGENEVKHSEMGVEPEMPDHTASASATVLQSLHYHETFRAIYISHSALEQMGKDADGS